MPKLLGVLVVWPLAVRGSATAGRLRAQPPIYAISDLHTDRVENMAWLRSGAIWPVDAAAAACVVAGDVSHRMDVLEETLGAISGRFAATFFVPGNHELWVRPAGEAGPAENSLEKLDQVTALCARLGVRTAPAMVGSVCVVPLLSWYDRSLAIPGVQPLPLRLWADFSRCRWPDWPVSAAHAPGQPPTGPVRAARVAAEHDEAVLSHLLQRNEANIARALADMRSHAPSAVLSLSHFLPCSACLPDWLEPEVETFDASWLSHGAARKAALFAQVAGSTRIDSQVRRLTAGTALPHVHVFGHSHRPKDFLLNGVRYVHNPVGKGAEREWGMLPPPAFRCLWDGAGRPTACPRPPLVRYWEQRGRRRNRARATKRTGPPAAARASPPVAGLDNRH